jgi:hypothetical protein
LADADVEVEAKSESAFSVQSSSADPSSVETVDGVCEVCEVYGDRAGVLMGPETVLVDDE